MQQITKLYLLICASLLFTAAITLSLYQNWFDILQASTRAEQVFLPIVLQDNIAPLGQSTMFPQATLVPTSTLIVSTATPTILPPTTSPTATLVPYDLSQRIDVGPFIFYASDDMVEIDVQGIDSLVKEYRNSQMEILLDYGWYSGYSPHSSEITLTIDGFDAIYNTRRSNSSTGYKYYSSILFEDFDLSDPYNRLGMYIRSSREDAAEVALAVFSTIDFPQEPGVYPLDTLFDVGPLTFNAFASYNETTLSTEPDLFVRKYSLHGMEITVKYGDSLNYVPNGSQTTLTIDGLEALYNACEADSESEYGCTSTIYFEKMSTSDSSDSFIMEIYSWREDATEAALAIFNTIKFKNTVTPVPTQPETTMTVTPATTTPLPSPTPT